MRVLIADDEQLAREELRFLLMQNIGIEIVAEAKNGLEALELIKELKPDAVFLDIQMPKLNGFEVAKEILNENHKPIVIFATAFDQYAIKAFELNALDYILKPFEEERVIATLQRIEKELTRNISGETIFKLINNLKMEKKNARGLKIALQEGEKIIFLTPLDIVFAFKDERELKIYTFDKVYSSKLSLRELEEKLKEFPFFRPHRSYIVNLNEIKEMEPWFNGAYNLKIKLIDGNKTIPVSRNYVKSLLEHLEI